MFKSASSFLLFLQIHIFPIIQASSLSLSSKSTSTSICTRSSNIYTRRENEYHPLLQLLLNFLLPYLFSLSMTVSAKLSVIDIASLILISLLLLLYDDDNFLKFYIMLLVCWVESLRTSIKTPIITVWIKGKNNNCCCHSC